MNRRLAGIVSALSVLLALSGVGAARADDYRSALKRYWNKFFKGEGITPLFYASTIHQPKTIWERGSGAMEFFSSGEELFPAAYVPVMVAAIGLGDFQKSGETSAAVALQLAGMNAVDDAKLKIAGSSEYKWVISMRDPEMHFIALRDANRCVMHVTGAVRKGYFQEMSSSSDDLLVVTRAIYVKSFEVSVSRSSSLELDVNADFTKDLVNAGFKLDSQRKSATLLVGRGMYLAAGFRKLRKEGAPVGAGGDSRTQLLGAEDLQIEVPEITRSDDGASVPPLFD